MERASAKALGAYYTPARLAETLCEQAIDRSDATILDPSCGDGSFLSAAVQRLKALGVRRRRLPDQIAGVEIEASALAKANGALLSRHPSLRWSRLVNDDFFSFAEAQLGKIEFDVVIGNPPYIRYQKFTGRDRAAQLAEKVGVKLNRESASWAPFLAVASAFVRPGGRLAMVVPREARFVNYARPLLEYLREKFGGVSLTEVPGLPFNALQKVSLLVTGPPVAGKSSPLDSTLRSCTAMSDVARVRLGIVTGGKDFFVLPKSNPGLKKHLVPVVSTPTQLKGIEVRNHEVHQLLRVRSDPDAALRRYIKEGEQKQVHLRYKCRIRKPWYAVPEQDPPHAFLAYLAGEYPRLALNRAGARATNNLHGVWWNRRATAWTVAYHNWLTLLSIEKIGRVYGGGVIKLEPGDAARVRIPEPPRSRPPAVDRLLRHGEWERVMDRVSEWLLPSKTWQAARREWRRLRARR